MNIVHLINDKEFTGVERYALDLCRATMTAGHRVVAVINPRAKSIVRMFEKEHVPVMLLEQNGLLDFTSPVRLSRLLRSLEGPVIIHCHNFKSGALAWRMKRLMPEKRILALVTRHHVKPADTTRARLGLYNALDGTIFVSQRVSNEFYSASPAPELRHAKVIYNGTVIPSETSPAKPQPGRAEILYAGRLTPEKGLKTLIEALASLPDGLDWHLTVCGQGRGNYVMPLVRFTRERHLQHNITWAGEVPDPALYMYPGTIGVVPTITPEAFGLSVVEMMAHGMAVITTDNGAQPEIITNGKDGILIKPDNVPALAQAIEDLIKNPERAAELGRNAAATVAEKFSLERMSAETIDLYNNLFFNA